MLLTKRPTTQELADELRRREAEPPVRELGTLKRWRRTRMSRHLGRSDYKAVLRAYYGQRSAQHG